jgi:hypothetical protein
MVGVDVIVAVWVTVDVNVMVGVAVTVGVMVGVGVTVGVVVIVGVAVTVRVTVVVGVAVGEPTVLVTVCVGVAVNLVPPQPPGFVGDELLPPHPAIKAAGRNAAKIKKPAIFFIFHFS